MSEGNRVELMNSYFLPSPGTLGRKVINMMIISFRVQEFCLSHIQLDSLAGEKYKGFLNIDARP